MRAHLRYLGISSGSSNVREHVQIEQVVVTELALRTLRRHLDTPGRWRGGLLFGEIQDQTLSVALSTSPGYPWYDGNRQTPLHVDERYVLGWSDCVEAVYGYQVDWVGNWLIAPDNHLGDLYTHLEWLFRGAAQALFSDQHPLLVLGWVEGILQGRAYFACFEEWREVNCRFKF